MPDDLLARYLVGGASHCIRYDGHASAGHLMDREILAALTETLLLLSEARCQIEGEVALTTAVNKDLRNVLRRLKGRPVAFEQPVPSSAADNLATHQQLQLEVSADQQLQPATRGGIGGRQQNIVAHAATSNNRLPKPAGPRVTAAANTAPGNRASAARTGASTGSGTAAGRSRAQPAVCNRYISSSKGQPAGSSAKQVAAAARPIAQLGIPAPTTAAAPAAAAGIAGAYKAVTSAAEGGPAPQLQPWQEDAAPALPTELPRDFAKLVQQYSLLQQQLKDVTPVQELKQGITSSAAAGFMSSLHKAYGSNAPAAPHQQSAGSTSERQLSLGAVARQAEYVGLVSAALWAVQVLTKSNPATCSFELVQPSISSIMQQCQVCLQQHNSQQQQQQLVAQQSAQLGLSLDLANGQTDAQLQDAVRWRNRCLRSILSTAQANEAEIVAVAQGSAKAATDQHAGVVQSACGIWLPEGCWQPLLQIPQANDSSSISSGNQPGPPWQRLLPAQQQQQQQLQENTVELSMTARQAANFNPSAGPRVPVLLYSDVQQLVQHSRHVQRLQQLLLHQHVEANLVPQLLGCLLRGCESVCQQVSNANRQQQGQRGRSLPGQAKPAAAAAAADVGVTAERCLALYRLLYSLVAAPAKRRGLGGGCHLVKHELVDDVAMLQWL